MGKKRKSISPSLRWSVFARDNFTCRYCGAKAGEDGVVLAADHLLSVAEGGLNTYENLITACERCNGGKGARSLINVPDSEEVAARMADRAKSIKAQADAMAQALANEQSLKQEAVNLKCQAYGVNKIHMVKGEHKHIVTLCREHGADNVLNWYRLASDHDVPEDRAIKYVYGIIRNQKEQQARQDISADPLIDKLTDSFGKVD